ncbi:MAG: right-handed parallel beta-helix repeat-containing protein, partial [Thermoplasmata archaeon]
MGRKVIAIWLSLIMIVGFVVIVDVSMDFTVNVGGTTLYVNTTGSGGAYTSIQDAINDSKDGDTVFVYNGTYYEHIDVNKTINLTGEGKDITKIDGGENGIVVNVSADWVNITGFTITGSGMDSEEAGIKLINVQNCGIINNNVSWNYWSRGIYLFNSSKNNITSNIISYNYFGIMIFYSNENILTNNTLFSNAGHGIYLYSSNGHRILYNNASFNGDYGILISSSNGNNITDNIASSNNKDGIRISASIMNNITINNASLNKDVGIYVSGGERNNITANEINHNDKAGIFLYYTQANRAFGNLMKSNGIIIWGASIDDWNTHEITSSNKVNNKLLYYWKNQNGGTVPLNAGQVILANCTNVRIENQKLSYATKGIQLGFSSNIIIVNNNVSNNKNGIDLFNSNENTITGNIGYLIEREGIRLWTSDKNNIIKNNLSNSRHGVNLWYSDDNNFTDNSLSHNSYSIYIANSIGNNIVDNNIFSNINGLYLGSSPDNRIYHNNIMENTNQAFDNDNNQWDNDYPSGGNYWSDYNGVDKNSTSAQNVPPPDGIGDTPYIIDSNSQDNYPLMYPIGNIIFLYEGWNLISIPLIQQDSNLTAIFSTIIDSYDSLQLYNISDTSNPWKHYQISKTSNMNDLNILDHPIRIWIHIIKSGGILFEYTGTQPASNQTIQLHPGWNMVGYPSVTNHNRSDGLNNLTFGQEIDLIQ